MSPSVVAVATTGIYCRPGGCSGQPKPENTLRFPTAAAAEAAGYRACLKCRPYRLPVQVPSDSSELVCRAVRLIVDGALDDAVEPQLANRLGVSTRHLRRLFAHQLGVTPAGLARSARAHFARRLLDETDLPVTEIAYIAGFGSLRQFNRVCQDVFRATPLELRSKRRKADRLVADGGLALRLGVAGAPDWYATLAYLAAHAIPGVEHVDGRIYRRTVMLSGDPGVIELMPGGTSHLILRAHLPHWEELIHVAERARRIASPDAEPVINGASGVRPPGTWDGFDVGVRAIVAAETPDVAVNAKLRHVVVRLGREVPGLSQIGLRHTFPPPHTVALAGDDDLGLPGPLSDTVRDFARAVATDRIRLDGSVSLGELASAITSVGISQPTARYIASRVN